MTFEFSRRRVLAALLVVGASTHASATGATAGDGDGARDRRMSRVDPTFGVGEIHVSLADRRLYYVRSRSEAISYPIATPRDQDMWTGSEVVTRKMVNPPWRPTPTMMRENPRLPTYVPGGHQYNPMGARALYLGNTYYRIHGTDAPWLIGENISKGCIRMHDEHVIELFDGTRIGARVVVVKGSLAGNAGGSTAAAKHEMNGP